METKVLPVSTEAFLLARDMLGQGELVAFPTDTVYGLGALVFDGKAVERIYSAKDRPAEKAIPVLIADLSDLEKVSQDVPEMAKRLAARYWPGPLTLVVPKKPQLPEFVSAGPTVGVRVPDHPAAPRTAAVDRSAGGDLGQYFGAEQSNHHRGSPGTIGWEDRIDP